MAESDSHFFPAKGLSGQMEPPYPLKHHGCFQTFKEVKSDVQTLVD
ncbi:MAG: hypothetical protein ABIJ44_07555 [Pseudomonadota bacterium]